MPNAFDGFRSTQTRKQHIGILSLVVSWQSNIRHPLVDTWRMFHRTVAVNLLLLPITKLWEALTQCVRQWRGIGWVMGGHVFTLGQLSQFWSRLEWIQIYDLMRRFDGIAKTSGVESCNESNHTHNHAIYSCPTLEVKTWASLSKSHCCRFWPFPWIILEIWRFSQHSSTALPMWSSTPQTIRLCVDSTVQVLNVNSCSRCFDLTWLQCTCSRWCLCLAECGTLK